MLKIAKYEFRKNRTSLTVMLLIAAALFLLAPLGRALHRDAFIGVSVVLLSIYAFAAYVYVLVRGIAAYSGELRGRTGYLLLMVPRSTVSVLFGKLLFSLAVALLMLAVSALALSGAVGILLGEVYQVEGALNVLRYGMLQMDVNPLQLAALVLFVAVEILSSVLTFVAVGYLAVTLSATVLQGGKLRGLLSFLFFVALAWASSSLTNLVSPGAELYETYADALRAALPALLTQVAVACAFTAASAALLRRRVSL